MLLILLLLLYLNLKIFYNSEMIFPNDIFFILNLQSILTENYKYI